MKPVVVAVFIGFFGGLTWANVDCSIVDNYTKPECSCGLPENKYAQRCLRPETCKAVQNIEFGGNRYSQFETKSCAALISQFGESERNGNFHRRMDDFMKAHHITKRFRSDCPQEQSDERRDCITKIFKIEDKIRDDRDIFVEALRYKVAVYDSIYQENRGDLLGKDCQKPSALKSPSEYNYSKKSFANDCEMIGLNAPKCHLKLDAVAKYSAANQKALEDRNLCQKYILANSKQPQDELLTHNRQVVAETKSSVQEQNHEMSCANFDPDHLVGLNTLSAHADNTLYCMEHAGESKNSSRTGSVRARN